MNIKAYTLVFLTIILSSFFSCSETEDIDGKEREDLISEIASIDKCNDSLDLNNVSFKKENLIGEWDLKNIIDLEACEESPSVGELKDVVSISFLENGDLSAKTGNELFGNYIISREGRITIDNLQGGEENEYVMQRDFRNIFPDVIFFYRYNDQLFMLTDKYKLIFESNTDQQIELYTLEKSSRIGVPVSNPTGIASDGTNLWVMSGLHNGNTHNLTYYDPENYSIINQFTYHNLIEVLGTGVYDITWDGKNIWISVSGNTNKLVKVDPNTGEVAQTWASPTLLGPSSLEWDGEKIWIGSGTGEIYSMNASNGGSELFLDNIGSGRDSGIAFRNEELWVGDLFYHDINIYNTIDGTYLGFVKYESTRDTFCFHNDQFVTLSSEGITFYDVKNK